MSAANDQNGRWGRHRPFGAEAITPITAAGAAPEPTIRSRRLLIQVLEALAPVEGALVVVGAHAVMHHAEGIGFQPEATADADTVLNPALVTDSPSILQILRDAGFEPASPDRPGIYGYAGEEQIPQRQRTTIDLIVPELYAGPGRRAARIPGQRNALTRAPGLELTLWDCSPATLSTLPGDGEPLSARVAVAGPGALLVAKAHKIGDRLAELHSRPHRLRPKDSRDVGLLMLASEPRAVAQRLAEVIDDHPETADIARIGMRFITTHYRSGSADGLVRSHLIDSLEDLPGLSTRVDTWIDEFYAAAAWPRP